MICVNWCSYTNDDTETKMRGHMGWLYPYSTRWVTTFLVFLHIYGDRVLFLVFCDYQDTESESCEIEIGVTGPIFTKKNTKGSLVLRYPYPTRWEKTIVSIHRIYGARAIFLLFCDHLDNECESCEK